jgi:hypothetical protein
MVDMIPMAMASLACVHKEIDRQRCAYMHEILPSFLFAERPNLRRCCGHHQNLESAPVHQYAERVKSRISSFFLVFCLFFGGVAESAHTTCPDAPSPCGPFAPPASGLGKGQAPPSTFCLKMMSAMFAVPMGMAAPASSRHVPPISLSRGGTCFVFVVLVN